METPQIGEVVAGRYEVGHPIGQGGFGVVVRADDLTTGEQVAIKFLHPHPGGYPDRVAARFRREAAAMTALRHPQTVQLRDFGTTDAGVLYIVMELVDGPDLGTALVQGRRFSETEVHLIARQLLETLQAAHSEGMVHRDIKPSNILLPDTPELSIKLADFGVVKIAEPVDGQPGLTATGAIVGSQAYMAPEQFFGESTTPSCDLFAAGIVLIELLFGREFAERWRSTELKRALEVGEPRRRWPDGQALALRGALEQMTQGPAQRRVPTAAAALKLLAAGETQYRGDEDDTTLRRGANKANRRAATTAVPRFAAIGGVLIAAMLFGGAVVWFATKPAEEPPRQAVPAVRASSIQSESVRATVVESDSGAADTPPAAASSGCGLQAPFEGLDVMSDGDILEPLTWTAMIPEGYDSNRPHALLVGFHPELLTAADMIGDRLQMSEIAARDGLVVVGLDQPTMQVRDNRSREALRAPEVVASTAEQLCIDPERVFVIGWGTGSDAATLLSCEPWVSAVATGARFPLPRNKLSCAHVRPNAPPRPVPHLYLAPMESAVTPVDGTSGCSRFRKKKRLSLADYESALRQRNGCGEEPQTIYDSKGTTCIEWECGSRLVSCHLAGGFFWPGKESQRWYGESLHGCPPDVRVADFAGTEYAWEFFKASPRTDVELPR